MMTVVFLFLLILLSQCYSSSLPSQLKCADKECNENISIGRVLQHTHLLFGDYKELKKSVKVNIKGKNVDINNSLWLVEYDGSKGFVDFSLLKENSKYILQDLEVVNNPFLKSPINDVKAINDLNDNVDSKLFHKQDVSSMSNLENEDTKSKNTYQDSNLENNSVNVKSTSKDESMPGIKDGLEDETVGDIIASSDSHEPNKLIYNTDKKENSNREQNQADIEKDQPLDYKQKESDHKVNDQKETSENAPKISNINTANKLDNKEENNDNEIKLKVTTKKIVPNIQEALDKVSKAVEVDKYNEKNKHETNAKIVEKNINLKFDDKEVDDDNKVKQQIEKLQTTPKKDEASQSPETIRDTNNMNKQEKIKNTKHEPNLNYKDEDSKRIIGAQTETLHITPSVPGANDLQSSQADKSTVNANVQDKDELHHQKKQETSVKPLKENGANKHTESINIPDNKAEAYHSEKQETTDKDVKSNNAKLSVEVDNSTENTNLQHLEIETNSKKEVTPVSDAKSRQTDKGTENVNLLPTETEILSKKASPDSDLKSNEADEPSTNTNSLQHGIGTYLKQEVTDNIDLKLNGNDKGTENVNLLPNETESEEESTSNLVLNSSVTDEHTENFDLTQNKIDEKKTALDINLINVENQSTIESKMIDSHTTNKKISTDDSTEFEHKKTFKNADADLKENLHFTKETKSKESLVTESKLNYQTFKDHSEVSHESEKKAFPDPETYISRNEDPWLHTSDRMRHESTDNYLKKVRSPLLMIVLRIESSLQNTAHYIVKKISLDSSIYLTKFVHNWLCMSIENFVLILSLLSTIIIVAYTPKMFRLNRDWKLEFEKQRQLIVELQSKLRTIEEVRQKLTVQNYTFEKVVDEYKGQVAEIQEEASKNTKTIRLELERIKKSSENKMGKLYHDLELKVQQCNILEKDLSAKEVIIEDIRERLRETEINCSAELTIKDDNIKDLMNQLIEMEDLRKKLETMSEEKVNLKEDVVNLSGELRDKNDELNKLNSSFESLQMFDGLGQDECREMVQKCVEYSVVREELNKVQSEVSRLREALEQSQREIGNLESKNRNSERLVAEYKEQQGLATKEQEAAELRLRVLTEYFHKKEVEMQRSLGQESVERSLCEDKAEGLRVRVKNLEAENEGLLKIMEKLKVEVKQCQTFANECKSEANSQVANAFTSMGHMERELAREREEVKQLNLRLSHYIGPIPANKSRERPLSRQSDMGIVNTSIPPPPIFPLGMLPHTNQSRSPFSGRNSVNSVSKRSNHS